MQCDLCGTEEALYEAEIEGTIMKVGQNCASFGKNVRKIRREEPKPKQVINYRANKEEPIKMIVKNYPELVKNAREKLNLKQEDFAKKINEKTSLIHNVESGKQKPSIKLAEKLEKALGIMLIEIYEPQKVALPASKSENDMTIGSIVNIKTRKKN